MTVGPVRSAWIVLLAEARRSARAPATHALRFGTAVLAVGLAAVFAGGRAFDGAPPPAVAHALLVVLRDLGLLLGLLLAAILPAVAATRDPPGALALLEVTRLDPRGAVAGLLAGRLLLPLSISLVTLPLVALAPVVDGWQVALAAAGGCSLQVAAGVVSGALALRTGRVVTSALAALTAVEVASFHLPHGALAAATGGAGPADLLPVLALLALPAAVVVVARPDRRPHPANGAVGAGAAALLGLLANAQGSLLLTTAASAAIGVAAVEGGAWLFRPRPIAARPSRTVLGNPLAWRALAGTGALGWLATLAWGLWVVRAFWATPGNDLREPTLDPGRFLLIVGVVATVGAAVASTTEDASLLAALRATPFPAGRVLAGQLAGTAVRGLPFLVAGAALRGHAAADVPWILSWWAAVACGTIAVARRLPPTAAWAVALVGAWMFVQVLALLPLVPGGDAALAWLAPPLLDGSRDARSAWSTVLHLAAAGVFAGTIRR